MEITNEQMGILKHTRDTAANRQYCGDSEDMQVLCNAGLMKYIGIKFSSRFFEITRKGLNIINKK